jgi:hypothetical protein
MVAEQDDSNGSLSIRSLVIFSAAMVPSVLGALTVWVVMSRIVAASIGAVAVAVVVAGPVFWVAAEFLRRHTR